ncbi:hypothetical protein GRX03_13330 [Halovenus sp. WSH3]|uniref:Uncharacterized protein n=1 Tax=Halovenus carboxidivorans TaxID=2692199 RepID=A0A6B0T6N9_9EURY|nr:DUF5812 family protein [Halovenus carboxidivorans]MXR52587.1 hypothetical protein [Halovenus carboxidivorans]
MSEEDGNSDELSEAEKRREEDPIAGMYDDPDSDPSPVRPGEAYDDEDDDGGTGLTGPMAEQPEEPETKSGTYYVKYAEDEAVTLHDVNTAEICTLIENPGVETHDIVEATLVAQPPMEVSYFVKELTDHYTIDVERSPEPPTTQVMEISEEMGRDEVIAIDREGEGEIHILKIDPDLVEQTADSLDDEENPYKNAARYGVNRVEVRTDEESGVISIRYLP